MRKFLLLSLQEAQVATLILVLAKHAATTPSAASDRYMPHTDLSLL